MIRLAGTRLARAGLAKLNVIPLIRVTAAGLAGKGLARPRLAEPIVIRLPRLTVVRLVVLRPSGNRLVLTSLAELTALRLPAVGPGAILGPHSCTHPEGSRDWPVDPPATIVKRERNERCQFQQATEIAA